ncbi:MAG: hypothetical protein U1C53_01830, partial [Candidatus Veblenbacteria bacterium]|nr:hypothetical protein [Candidatus Veblenbacteria bacterium]
MSESRAGTAQWWQQPWFQLAAAFVVALAIFAWLQPPGLLADPDSWYHARLTSMMRDGGLVWEFPWTQASLYRTIFIDHHFLYHALLIPFVSLAPNDLGGLQLATVLFAALSATAVAWCLLRWRVPWWGVGMLVLLTSAPFLFRLSLAKAPSLAIGVALVAYYLITERRLGGLFFWTWFFVWFYSAWPLVVVMTAVFIAVSALSKAGSGVKAVVREIWLRPN